MAYSVKRRKNIDEEFNLLNPDDTIFKTLRVNLSVQEIAKEFRHTHIELIHAQQEVKKHPEMPEKIQALGDGYIKLLTLIFGAEQTQDIIVFYDENYFEMIEDINPFIFNCIAPAINQAVSDYRAKVMENNNYNRRQKRLLKLM